jgi:hypothetical protein
LFHSGQFRKIWQGLCLLKDGRPDNLSLVMLIGFFAEEVLGIWRGMTGLDIAGKRHARCQGFCLRFSRPSVPKITNSRAASTLKLLAPIRAALAAEGAP